MAKKTKIVVGSIVFLFIASGLIWWFMPVHFLREVEPKEAAMIVVLMGITAMNLKSPTQVTFLILRTQLSR